MSLRPPPTAPWACIKASGTPLINEINHSTTIPFTFDSNNDDPILKIPNRKQLAPHFCLQKSFNSSLGNLFRGSRFVFVTCKRLLTCLVIYIFGFRCQRQGVKGRKARFTWFQFMCCVADIQCMHRVISEMRIISRSWISASLFALIVFAFFFSTSFAGSCKYFFLGS